MKTSGARMKTKWSEAVAKKMGNRWLAAARKREKPRVQVAVLPCETFGLDLAIRNAAENGRTAPSHSKWLLKADEAAGVLLISNPGDLLLIATGLAKEREKKFKELFKFSQLAHCESTALKEMARFATRLFVDANEYILRQGDPADRVYFLVSGRCTVLQQNAERPGGPEKAVNAMGPGSTFGQLGVLGSQPRAASVASITACELLWLHAYDYCRLIDAATMAEMKLVATKFNEMTQMDVVKDTAIQAALNGRRMGDKGPGSSSGDGSKLKSRSIKVIRVDKGAGRAAAQRKYEEAGLADWELRSPRVSSGGGAISDGSRSSRAGPIAREKSSFLPAIKPSGFNTVR